FLYRYRKLLQIKVSAITIDHQLRSETSEADVKFVQSFCEALNIPCYSRTVSVPEYQAKHALGTQLAARELRYQAYQEVMQAASRNGHTRSHDRHDQIETHVMQLTKTTNLHTLTRVPTRRSVSFGAVVRPFLCVTKQDIYEYANNHQPAYRLDESNLEN